MGITSSAAPPAGAHSFSHFNADHWHKVKSVRASRGIERATERGKSLPAHRLVGKTVIQAATGKAFVVESVKKDWFQGWFLTALLSHKGSHAHCFVENISCVDKGIEESLADFNDDWSVPF